MRTITITIPDEIHRQAQLRAAAQGRSVDALVLAFLASLSEPRNFDQLLSLQNDVLTEIDTFRASDRLDRDSLHERQVPNRPATPSC